MKVIPKLFKCPDCNLMLEPGEMTKAGLPEGVTGLAWHGCMPTLLQQPPNTRELLKAAHRDPDLSMADATRALVRFTVQRCEEYPAAISLEEVAQVIVAASKVMATGTKSDGLADLMRWMNGDADEETG